MGKIAGVAFSDTSETKYSFEAYTLDTKFNNIGAVYIFTKRTVSEGKGTHQLLYIGETGELADRISNHEKWTCVNEHGVNCICVHADKNDISRLKKEDDLIRAYKTPCNEA